MFKIVRKKLIFIIILIIKTIVNQQIIIKILTKQDEIVLILISYKTSLITLNNLSTSKEIPQHNLSLNQFILIKTKLTLIIPSIQF